MRLQNLPTSVCVFEAICRAGFAFGRFNTHLRPEIEFNTSIALTQKLADEIPSILKFELDSIKERFKNAFH